jgi:hypothetical protein
MKLKIFTTELNKIRKNFSLNELELTNILYAIYCNNTLTYYSINHELIGVFNLNSKIVNIFNSLLNNPDVNNIRICKIPALYIDALWIKSNIENDIFYTFNSFGDEKDILNEKEFIDFIINRYLNK